ncbi:DUF7525 family protein [Natrialbaceae archaeon AArc-T1-2]|uniref:DUF7525 family protein n=1 Tax=Natrialbaceae archaeon AArc-T1-2 TaxID=3053904 RepID=UPI00255AA986|nr:hypothetical protein [Natrialbaceae archaeon AArc-T1-2]WIV67261.1 hypothetical protein QQ977_00620 [Natrialbaceae archaeon AArc-T1-2]
MANATESTTDKELGLALILGFIAAAGAVGMFVGAPEIEAAWGFAAAMVFSTLAVVAIHLY